MGKPFKGTINIDIQDSTPGLDAVRAAAARRMARRACCTSSWTTSASRRSSRSAGSIETPNINRIADNGLIYTNFHTTALCSPTRSCLLTGRNHTTNGMACISEASSGFPNANGHIPMECATVRGGAGRAGLEHLHGRQVAPVRRGRGEPGLDPAAVAGRPRFRALLRVPGRGDEPVVPRPRLRQPPGRPAEDAGRGLPLLDRHHRQGDRRSSATPRRSLRTSRSSSTTRSAPVTRRTTCRRSGRTSTRASSTWATRPTARLVFANQKKLGIIPEHAELSPINPYTDLKGPQGQEWPALDIVRPWESLADGREEAVRPDGGGLRGIRQPRRRISSGGCSTTSRSRGSSTTP